MRPRSVLLPRPLSHVYDRDERRMMTAMFAGADSALPREEVTALREGRRLSPARWERTSVPTATDPVMLTSRCKAQGRAPPDSTNPERKERILNETEQLRASTEQPRKAPDSIQPEEAEQLRAKAEQPAMGNPGHYARSSGYLKPGTYAGDSSLDNFLAKFEICAKVNNWTKMEELAQLMCCLTGNAANLLCETDLYQDDSPERLKRRLQERYSTDTQMMLYRSQLHQRRQKRGETLSELVACIRNLIHLAYPQMAREHAESISTRCFVEALSNRDTAMHVYRHAPKHYGELLN